MLQVKKLMPFKFAHTAFFYKISGSDLYENQREEKTLIRIIAQYFKNMHFMNLTFRVLVNIHFQKYNY